MLVLLLRVLQITFLIAYLIILYLLLLHPHNLAFRLHLVVFGLFLENSHLKMNGGGFRPNVFRYIAHFLAVVDFAR